MRINVYSQELTDEVIVLEKESNTGRVYRAAQLILHSSEKLHHPPADDDRSAVAFWLPGSPERCESIARAFECIADVFRDRTPDARITSDAAVVLPQALQWASDLAEANGPHEKVWFSAALLKQLVDEHRSALAADRATRSTDSSAEAA